jgi:hypothetical protein
VDFNRYYVEQMANNSKKEIIIAVLVGLVTGLAFSYLLYFLNKKPLISEKKLPAVKVTSTLPFATNETAKPKTGVNHLVIKSPLNGTLVSEAGLTISGEAPKNSTIILFSENEEKVLELNNKENFQIETELTSGENQLTITAILKNNQEENINLTIIYQKEG